MPINPYVYNRLPFNSVFGEVTPHPQSEDYSLEEMEEALLSFDSELRVDTTGDITITETQENDQALEILRYLRRLDELPFERQQRLFRLFRSSNPIVQAASMRIASLEERMYVINEGIAIPLDDELAKDERVNTVNRLAMTLLYIHNITCAPLVRQRAAELIQMLEFRYFESKQEVTPCLTTRCKQEMVS